MYYKNYYMNQIQLMNSIKQARDFFFPWKMHFPSITFSTLLVHKLPRTHPSSAQWTVALHVMDFVISSHVQSLCSHVQSRCEELIGYWLKSPLFSRRPPILGRAGKEIAPLPTGFSDFILNESSPPNCTCAMLAMIWRGCGETDRCLLSKNHLMLLPMVGP